MLWWNLPINSNLFHNFDCVFLILNGERVIFVFYLIIGNKNRRKAICNWAAKGLFFLKGGGGYTHSGYHKTLSTTIACDRTSCETET